MCLFLEGALKNNNFVWSVQGVVSFWQHLNSIRFRPFWRLELVGIHDVVGPERLAVHATSPLPPPTTELQTELSNKLGLNTDEFPCRWTRQVQNEYFIAVKKFHYYVTQPFCLHYLNYSQHQLITPPTPHFS